MKHFLKRLLNIFSYGCAIVCIVFSIAFGIAFWIGLGEALWNYPLYIAGVCVGMAILIFIVGLISERHSKTLHKKG